MADDTTPSIDTTVAALNPVPVMPVEVPAGRSPLPGKIPEIDRLPPTVTDPGVIETEYWFPLGSF